MYRYMKILGLLFVLVVLGIHCGKDDNIAGKVGDEVVTVDQYKEALKSQFGRRDLSQISYEEKEKMLKEMLDYRLKLIKAKEMDLDKDPEFLKEIKVREDNMVAQKLYEQEIINSVIPPEIIATFMELRKFEIKGVGIVLGYENATKLKRDKSLEDATQLANEIASRLRNGEDAEALAEQYSDDPSGQKNKGRLDPYHEGMFDIAVDSAIVNANVGDVVGPIVSPAAIFVIKVNEKKEKPTIRPDEQVLPKLRQELFQRYYHNDGNERYKTLTEEYKKEYNAKILDENIEKLVGLIKEWTATPRQSDESFPEKGYDLELYKFNNHTFTGKDFLDKFNGRFYRMYSKYQTVEQITDAINNELNYKLWIYRARAQNFDKDEKIKTDISKLKEQRLVALVEQKAIRDRVSFTLDELKANYQENLDKYQEPRKIEVWEIAVQDQNLANKIYRMAVQKQASFESLAEKYDEKPNRQKKKGYLGYQMDKSPLGDMMEKIFNAGPNKILAPGKQGAFYHIFKTGQFQPQRTREFEEVQTYVEGAVKQDKGNRLRNEMMDDLHRRYPYWINQKFLREL